MGKSFNVRKSRRSFIKNLGLTAASITGVPSILAASDLKNKETLHFLQRPGHESLNDEVQIGVIGCGGMGWADLSTVLRHRGVRLVAAADLYQGNLDKVRGIYGKDIFTTRNYKELLAKKEIDAVIIATHDHWHKEIAVDALRSGKHVYLEKPMVHSISEGPELIDAQKKSGKVLEVGSQLLSSLGYEKSKELIGQGAIGTLNFAEGIWTRRTAVGAWNYDIPLDASEETISWETFLKDRPRVPFSGERFFRWRKYSDYGTGMNGDLFVHILSGLHFVTDSIGPSKIYSSGGIRFWKDGREVPDVLIGTFDYEEAEAHPGFNLSLRCNFVDGSNGPYHYVMRLVGSEGMMEVNENSVTLFRNKILTEEDPTTVLSMAGDEEARKKILGPEEVTYKASEDYKGSHYDHFGYWLNAIRTGGTVVEDAAFGFRAAAPAILCDESYRQEKVVKWDPVKMVKIN